MTQINPYLTFSGQCREAMHFYQECLGGELSLQTIGDSPMAAQWPAAVQKNILHASLTNNGIVLLGSDVRDSDVVLSGGNISLSINCSSEEEINRFFTNLSEGGNVTHPLHDFFAGKIGTLTDKFKIDWMFYYTKNPS
ncbi:VOC family protein [Dyadobacter bucti]|jgi:PhnB protein|uniref:VOC family protein n=1 Tax=Dyadobacter bucti TaxID=2572203 RepID=UPI003F6FAF9D